MVDLSPFKDRLILCEWRRYPSMEINENFFSEVSERLDLSKVESLYFICAAGIRSQEAMLHTRDRLVDLGKTINCFNIADGFQRNKNQFFSFGKTSGWKDCGLPWVELGNSNLHVELEG